jgi:hypothetical protein
MKSKREESGERERRGLPLALSLSLHETMSLALALPETLSLSLPFQAREINPRYLLQTIE